MPETNNLPANLYTPAELLNIFTTYLARQQDSANLIFMRGIYLRNHNHNPNWSCRFDTLRDEDSPIEITLKISDALASNLRDGNLVTVGGVLGRSMKNNSNIQLTLNVSRVEVVQEQVIDEDELKRIELRRTKATNGFKNVDALLEQKLFADDRPKIALVFAASSITMSDFEAGINAAKTAIDFNEHRVNFSSPHDMAQLLANLDQQNYDAIALVRGGGVKSDAVNDVSLLETVINLRTPIIAAIGHVEEKLFIKQLVDKEAPTPNGLGQYFSEMVETVSEKKSKSRAAITEKIKKQFQEQIESSQKQNKELQEKLAKLSKTQEETASKQSKQFSDLNKSLQQLTKTNAQINSELQNAKKKNATLQRQLNEAWNQPRGGVWRAIAIIAVIACIFLFLIVASR